MDEKPVVLDTNVFVAAGFNPRSASAQIVDAVRSGRLAMAWNPATRAESKKIVSQIPPIHWRDFADLFRAEHEYPGSTYPETFAHVEDPDDRKFAALADFAGAVLITNDEHLLAVRGTLGVPVLTPGEFMRQGGDR